MKPIPGGHVKREMLLHCFTLLLCACSAAAAAAAPATRPADIDAKAAATLQAWKPKLDAAGYRYLVAPPFVIAGDGGLLKLQIYRDQTILAAARALKHMYFDRDPQEPILILLLESEGPYKRVSSDWLNETSPPHFGYFQPARRVMVMNVGTGTGTLVHELTHALIVPDFPNVPSWFNEGLASLYEQCTFVSNDEMRGLENWRLPALQSAIRAGKLRPLAQLVADRDFYDPAKSGLNYAQARYLMMYLQEKGLLRAFYRRFRDHAADDPTGLNALRQTIAPLKLEAFETEWRAWVLKLRFGAP